MALEWLLVLVNSGKSTWRAGKTKRRTTLDYTHSLWLRKTTAVSHLGKLLQRNAVQGEMAAVTKSNKFFTAIITWED